MDAYISRVSSQGQVTLPKQVRKMLKVDKEDYLEFDIIGKAIVLKKVKIEDETLKTIRDRIKKSGLKRKDLDEIIKECKKEVWEETYGKTLS